MMSHTVTSSRYVNTVLGFHMYNARRYVHVPTCSDDLGYLQKLIYDSITSPDKDGDMSLSL